MRLCRYCRSRSVSSVASSLQYRSMFRLWRRTWAGCISVILRHLFGCSSVVLFIAERRVPAAAPDTMDQREVKPLVWKTVTKRFLRTHIRKFYRELIADRG